MTAAMSVAPTRCERGRLWDWNAVLTAAQSECAKCRPSIPCFRHVDPEFELVDYVAPYGSPAIGVGLCAGCGTQTGAPLPMVVTDAGHMVSRACPTCVERLVGGPR